MKLTVTGKPPKRPSGAKRNRRIFGLRGMAAVKAEMEQQAE